MIRLALAVLKRELSLLADALGAIHTDKALWETQRR
jgi:hypothetical protein